MRFNAKIDDKQMSNINNYTDEVCKHISWKKCHSFIKNELSSHVLEQRHLYISEGDDETTATNEAILQMGDTVSLGKSLNDLHKPKEPQTLLIFVGILIFLGWFFQSKFTYIESLIGVVHLNHYFLGGLAFIVCYFLDFSLLGKFAKYISLTFTALSLALLFISENSLIPQITSDIYNSFIVWTHPFIFALFVYARIKKGHYGVFLCFLEYLILTIPLLIFSSNVGTANILLFTISAFFIVSYAIIKNWFGKTVVYNLNKVLIYLIIFSVLGMIPILINPFALESLLVTFDPNKDPLGHGFLYLQVQDVIQNAKIIGASEFVSPIEEFLPTDFTLTYLVSRYGLLVLPLVSIPMLGFIVTSLLECREQKSFLGKLIIFSICIPLSLECFLYILYSVGLLLVDSHYPFITLDYMGCIMISGLMGLIGSVFRIGAVVRD